jgi:hypothetical protein
MTRTFQACTEVSALALPECQSGKQAIDRLAGVLSYSKEMHRRASPPGGRPKL